ncbi:Alpha/beta hydrolase fold-1 domain-containing protein [Penicillium ucsense]|uniref:Alpha/beta hydrolase fold-1 domain-containing protein n=1 Tax=Penicillium ucsense TaxID=2839758 RepID=A0A8J8VY45_9EURO|nr:Alpha/beta hydrolase fold-1 domain-containing protein [Penicillium ucsense]KAF7728971.1 Alpha/beta hydrolase fold-1 domain-containing protein [Penicillium ucsense]
MIHPTRTCVRLAYELLKASSHNASTRLTDRAPPILFLHGFLGSKRENRMMSKNLAQNLSRDVYALDLRNHGNSGHHPQHTYANMAHDVESFIHQHKLGRATLIGHSMGAKTALTLALQSPSLIAHVVAVDNAPIKLPVGSEFSKYLQSMARVEQENAQTHAEADEILRQYDLETPVRLWLLGNFVQDQTSHLLKSRVPLDILQEAIDPLGDFPYCPGSAKYQGPSLFLRALRSSFIPEDALREIPKLFHRSEIVNLDCGHWIVQERPQQFQEEVVKFLSRY